MIDPATKAAAERFARAIGGDPVLSQGFAATVEALEWALWCQWRVSQNAEEWRRIAGELSAVRQLALKLKTLGADNGKGTASDEGGTSTGSGE